MRRQKISQIIGLGMVVMITGCANNSANSSKIPDFSPQIIPNPVAADLSTCPADPTIVPVSDNHGDGTGYYTVCPKSDGSNGFVLHGKTAASNTVCVYQAKYVDDANIFISKDSAGNRQVSCYSAQTGGIVANFVDPSINFLIIVEKPFETQMNQCIIAATSLPSDPTAWWTCPAFSSGKVQRPNL